MTKITSIIGTIALAVVFLGAGFLVCLAPPATRVIAGVTSKVDVSPFDKDTLVAVADATRDYAFGTHDLESLYGVILDADEALADTLTAQGEKLAEDFPDLERLGTNPNLALLTGVFSDASDQYAYSADTIAHLDDCNRLAHYAYALIGVAAVAVIACLIHVGRRSGKRSVGGVLMAAGIVMLLCFVALGVWAIIDFEGLFAQFHRVFFSQGNWTFPFDSLLICALPTAFWAGMGILWLVVTVVLSLLSIRIGRGLRRVPVSGPARGRRADRTKE